ncbi:MAG: hypothetical protein RLZZ303_1619 [Candidatus Hydrogenedentota bacterium]|jgi:hypothetical protein
MGIQGIIGRLGLRAVRVALLALMLATASTAGALTLTISDQQSLECTGTFQVDVFVSDFAESQSLTSFGFNVLYETAVLDFVSLQRLDPVADWALVNANEPEPGRVIVGGAAFAGTPLTTEGGIIRLTFAWVCTDPQCTTTLQLANLSANTSGATTVDGNIACGSSTGEEGEGALEGSPEGVTEGEGAVEGEGAAEGVVEGAAEGEGEGSPEGVVEGQTEGAAEGAPEGSTEGAMEGQPEGSAEAEGEGEGTTEGAAEGEGEGDTEGAAEGEGEPEVFTVVVESITEDACTGTVAVDVSLIGLGQRSVSSFGIDISFDTSILTFSSLARGSNLENWGLLSSNIIAPGVIRIGGAALAGTPLTTSNVLFTLNFARSCAEAPCTTTLNVVALSANTASAASTPGVLTCGEGGAEGEGEGAAEGEGEGEGGVEDLPPTAVCQDLTVDLRPDGFAFITAAQVDGGSTDDVGIASRTLDRTSFNCSNVGANTVTLTVTDTLGQTSTCTATVTVRDAGVDVVACKNFATTLDINGTVTIAVTDIDNGSRDACGIESRVLSKTTFTCADIGQNTVTLTVTDRNGNVGTCEATVTIADVLFACDIPDSYTLSVQAQGNGTVNILNGPNAPDNLTYTEGTPVEIEAAANAGARFKEWQGDIDGATIDGASIEVIMNRNRAIVAVFEDAPPPFGCNAFNGASPLSCRCNAFGPSPSLEELFGQLFLGALTIMALVLMTAYQKRFW